MKFSIINKKKVFTPDSSFGWVNNYAQVPTVLIKEKVLRVYFATRPENNITKIGFVDLDINDFSNIINVSQKPVLELGAMGTFDEHGTMPSSVVELNNKVYLYYSGWQRSVGVPYNNFTGLAVSYDGGETFKKCFRAPIIDRNKNEIFSATSPSVIFENGIWHMWYCSGTFWHSINSKLEHTYDIKYAYSNNGIDWVQTGLVCIEQENEFEAITRPTVIKIDGQYHMWYCYRGSVSFRDGEESYKIGYATSENGIKWKRKDACFNLEPDLWDSKMKAYPEIVYINNKFYLFYNGNYFGREGFGYAELKIN
jgi:predicted GH43/DUF377 family glycosyl hydrolase